MHYNHHVESPKPQVSPPRPRIPIYVIAGWSMAVLNVLGLVYVVKCGTGEGSIGCMVIGLVALLPLFGLAWLIQGLWRRSVRRGEEAVRSANVRRQLRELRKETLNRDDPSS